MGLGKSLESLMLITSNPPPEDWPITTVCHAPPDKNSPAVPIQTTLLVVPSNLIQQWQDEIKQHIQPGKLNWLVTLLVVQ
jgi:SNF2 family DNA or RNA helicase